jgi:hypothetical protein
MSTISMRPAPAPAPSISASGGVGRPSPGAVFGRRLRPVRLLLSVLLVLACAVAAAVLAGRLDERLPVLATARPLAAGQTIADADLTVVHIAVDGAVTTVPQARRGSVVGGTAAVPLPAGVVLSPAHLGASGWPPPGEAVVAVAVKPGRLPSTITAGAHVTVIAVPATDNDNGTGTAGGPSGASGDAGVVRAEASVVHLSADQTGYANAAGGEVAVSLLMDAAAASRLAAAGGEVSLVHHGPGR